jgi:hypothetical protein
MVAVMLTALLLAVSLLALASPLSAQPLSRFADLALAVDVGDDVGIDAGSGDPVWGRLVRLTPDEIAIEGAGRTRAFARDEVSRVLRRGDGWRNGVLLGTAAGAVLGCVFAAGFAERWRFEDCPVGVVMLAPVGAGLGLAIDALVVGERVIFTAPDNARRSPAGVTFGIRLAW